MRWIAALGSVACLLAAAPPSFAETAEWADWRIEYVQLNEAGEQIEHSVWRCSPAAILTSCDQGVMVVIDGRPQPVDIGVRYDGSVVRVTAARGAWRLDVRSGNEPIKLGQKGFVATAVEIWDTFEPRLPSTTNDLVWRRPFQRLASINLLAQRLTTARVLSSDTP